MESLKQPDMRSFFWFYEWNMFEAVRPGQHTGGRFDFDWVIDAERAVLDEPPFRIEASACPGGAELSLTVTNSSGHDWPEPAGIIPCFNPGPPAFRTQCMVDEDHRHTYFLGAEGLERLHRREIHFNRDLRPSLEGIAQRSSFEFSHKWPNSDRNAYGGLLIRESSAGGWVTGIAWEDFLSSQGHNPWYCMHLCVRVGPLPRGESRTVRGRIYLFQGTAEDCLERYRRDFA